MTIRITFCAHCYADQARALANELRGTSGAEVELVEGKLGQLDVHVDGELVASRGEGLARRLLSHAPDTAKMLAAIERHFAGEDGESCAIPAAGRPSEPR